MTLGQACDVTYLLMREQVTAQVLADRTGLLARGVTRGLPEVEAELDALDARLAAEIVTGPTDRNGKPLTREEWELRRAMGVA